MDSSIPAPGRVVLSRFAEYSSRFAKLLEAARRELCVFDPDARQLELGRRDRSQLLFQFLRGSPTRKIHVVLHETRHLEADCPRFLDLLAQFSGQIDVRITRGQARHVEDCFVVVDALHLIRRPVASQPRGVLLENDPAAAATQLERYEQIQCESDPGLEAGSLGLD